MIELQNKVILITGATSGIGYATAMYFASVGAKVVGTARKETKLADELTEAGAADALLITADMTKEDQVVQAIEDTLNKFDHLHFAFNNAGIFLHEAPLDEHNTATWNEIINANLTSIYYCMKHEIRAMQSKGASGAIINNASVVGHRGSTASGIAYTAAKHGVIGMTRQAAIGYATSGIRVNAVSPGPTLTPATRPGIALPESHATAKINELNPTGQMAPLETIAATVGFLCSDLAQGINGHDVPIDGGQLAKL